MTITLFVAIMAFVLLAIVAIIPLYENYGEYKLLKKVYITLCVILLFCFGILDIFNRFFESKSDKSDLAASITNTSEGLGFKIDKSNNTLSDSLGNIHVDLNNAFKNIGPNKARIIKYPIIKLSSQTGEYNPIITKTNKEDSVQFEFTVLNEGNAGAYNLKGYLALINEHNGEFNIIGDIVPLRINKSIFLLPKDPYSYISLLTYNKNGRDTSFLFVKLNYRDSLAYKNSFTGIYVVHTPDLRIFDADPDSYNKIANLFVGKK
ncbi:hypothetical protein SAMN05216490_0852 [Mucilaginibacter mallensis]|uniref:Uncharacterized protein n=1 Tax=Mucilaginibacter mallensis TaxID=652787 RepID=A0A1H1QUG1_MUCMA|nr:MULTISPECIES: hypothetical protein [Mucilaginibacter]MBB6140440.1 hypothetical protein [Mucilaginibacter sp. X5P1]SDS27037.1 hypothetical protein SAMN05216490_0852 [Mucilaginibacter mallensis]